ncbi:hypothetical protein ACQKM2_13590 [Streptomyces sp. NPDC004126]|uniref:hypothetical protein n=1 Tax=Streptomyces sp. NPDC004126 TaxID=3390695 RepID=UPI003D033FB7
MSTPRPGTLTVVALSAMAATVLVRTLSAHSPQRGVLAAGALTDRPGSPDRRRRWQPLLLLA